MNASVERNSERATERLTETPVLKSSFPNQLDREAHTPGAGVGGIVRPIEQAERAISEFDQDQVRGWIQHAEVLFLHREFGAAQTVYRHVLSIDSFHQDAIGGLAAVLEKTGRLEEALKCRRTLAKLAPSIVTKLNLASLQYRLEDDAAALQSYQECLVGGIVPESHLFEVYKNVGNILVRRGSFDEAEEFYNRAFAIEPKSDALLVNFGTLEINRDNLEGATARFRCAVEINSANDKAWVGLALVHRAKGDFELSWGNLERALDLAPTNRTALGLFVEWAVRDGRLQAAVQRLQSHLDRDGEDAEMAFSLAKCLTLMGLLGEALFECERVVALDPDQTEALRLRQVLAERIVAEPKQVGQK